MLAVAVLVLIPGIAYGACRTRPLARSILRSGSSDEPAYVGVPNASSSNSRKLAIRSPTSAMPHRDRRASGTKRPTRSSSIRSEEPGQYQAPFVPSQAGAYTFTLAGTLDGVTFDLSLTSGPKTFIEVQDLAGATFPAVQFPTNAELATRIQTESDRVTTAVTAATTAGTDAAVAASSAQDAADSAKTIGIVGVVVGAIGLIVGIVAFIGDQEAGVAFVLAHGGTPDEQVAMVTIVAGLWLGWAGVNRIREKGFPRLPIVGAWSLAVVGGVVVIAGLTLPRQFMRPNVATPTPIRRASRVDRDARDRRAIVRETWSPRGTRS